MKWEDIPEIEVGDTVELTVRGKAVLHALHAAGPYVELEVDGDLHGYLLDRPVIADARVVQPPAANYAFGTIIRRTKFGPSKVDLYVKAATNMWLAPGVEPHFSDSHIDSNHYEIVWKPPVDANRSEGP